MAGDLHAQVLLSAYTEFYIPGKHIFLDKSNKNVRWQINIKKKWFAWLYTVYQENEYFVKNMLLLKNSEFLPNHYETLSKFGPHE